MLRFGSDCSAAEKLEKWIEKDFALDGVLPFSFKYGGVCSSEILSGCTYTREVTQPDKDRKLVKLTFKAPDGLKITAELIHFQDFPAAEWILYFENTGKENSALIEEVKALKLGVEYSPFRTAGTQQYGAHDNILTYSGGSDCKIDDFLPLKEVFHYIANKKSMHFGSMNGRPTSGSHGCMPYFNMKTMDCGVILALGWAGQWEMDVYTGQHENDAAYLSFEGGMPDMHISLHPGEKIRTPRILMMPWVGQQEDGQNLFRGFMTRHHTPHVNGEPVKLPISVSSWGTSEQDHLRQLDYIAKAGLPVDTYWIDAGWYGPAGTHCDIPTCNDWSDNVGYWEHDPLRYPNGLKPVSDRVHELGMKFLLWFEHERAVDGTPLTIEHPEFFLERKTAGTSSVFNLGKPEALRWMTEMLSSKITEYGIDVLRIDQNVDTLDAWNSGDEPGRQGITQIRCVEGLYKLWDTLLERHPGLLIDNCASGGRRLEFEAMGRSVSLFRTDYSCYADNDPAGHQMQTCGLGMWVPVSSPGGNTSDLYSFRSTLNQGTTIGNDMVQQAAEQPELLKKLKGMFAEFHRLRDLYAANMYHLTDVTISWKDWLGYELYSPELRRGAVLSFRRDECPFEQARYKLKGLDPQADYRVENADTGEVTIRRGVSLMEEGLSVCLDNPKSSNVTYINMI